uniref:PNPLA domain-containing protein n=1 Tax=Mesocestoides corti TaxID=53468 RepID=A0A5K3F7V7_MESCO
MQSRFNSTSTEAEEEVWSSSSIDELSSLSQPTSQVNSQRFHPIQPKQSPPLRAPPLQQQHQHHHHIHHHARESQQHHKSNESTTHQPPMVENQIFSSKTLGIEVYETEGLFANLRSRQASTERSTQLPYLSPFQHRCIHAVADMVTSPHTILPTLVSVFLRPDGTKKGIFSKNLSIYLKAAYRRKEKKTIDLQYKSKIPAALLPTAIALVFSYICGLIFGWQLGFTIGLTSVTIYLMFICLVFYGGLVRRWKSAQQIGETLMRYARSWSLIMDILFCRPPVKSSIPTNIRLLPVNLRLGSSETPWEAAVQLSEKMWEATTSKYSKTATYLQFAAEDAIRSTKPRFRRVCCLPSWAFLPLWILSLLTWTTVHRVYAGPRNNSNKLETGLKVALIVSGVVWLLGLLAILSTIFKPITRLIKVQSRFRQLKRDNVRLMNSSQISSDSVGSTDSFNGICKQSQPSRETNSQQLLLSDGSPCLEEGLYNALEAQLRQESLDTCHTLHLLDIRCDRQTRVFISVDATAWHQIGRVAEFCQTISRFLISPVEGGPRVLWRLADSLQTVSVNNEATQKSSPEACPQTPNIFLIIVCSQDIDCPSDQLLRSESCDKFWQQMHDACCLTLYIDEPTVGPQQHQDGSHFDSLMGSRCSVRSIHHSDPSSLSELWSKTISIPEFFINDHPLADINANKLQYLLTSMAFLGRMLRTEEFQSTQAPLLEVAATWLCLLLHWPFHTTWLSLFLEEHYSPTGNKCVLGSDDEASTASTSRPVLPTDTLSMLYSRVLERLGPALSACRIRTQSSTVQSTLPTRHSRLPSVAHSKQASAALRLCELSAHDFSPARLASFLLNRCHGSRSSAHSVSTVDVTVSDLSAVMACSPFLNPKIRGLIQDYLNVCGFSLASSDSKDRHVNHSLQALDPKAAEFPPLFARTGKPSCPVPLKNGLLRKPLSMMTVDDVCHLVTKLAELKANQRRVPSTALFCSDSPQPLFESPSLAVYLSRLRALNISGAVLAVCPINEALRRDIGMALEDWRLFSKLITYLKGLESAPPSPLFQHCQCFRSMLDFADVRMHLNHAHTQTRESVLSSKAIAGVSTSESILAVASQRWKQAKCLSPGNGSNSDGSAMSTINDDKWSEHQRTVEREDCRLSGGSCSVYSADIICSSKSDCSFTSSSSPSFSSAHNEGAQKETATQWKHDVDV